MSEESWNILSSTNPEIERNIYAYNSTLLELNCPFSSIPEWCYVFFTEKNHSRIEEKCNLMLAIVFQHIFIIQSYVFELSTS